MDKEINETKRDEKNNEFNEFEKNFLKFEFTKPYRQNEMKTFNGVKRLNFNFKIPSRYIKEFDKHRINSSYLFEDTADIKMEDVPFAEGENFYFFRGSSFDTMTKISKTRLFKLPKYNNINLEDYFLAQNIASYLAVRFSKPLVLII